MSEKDGGPAFPMSREQEGWCQYGMSLRDWFAGQALAGWLATYGPDLPATTAISDAGDIAEVAYRVADAMLAERLKERP